MPEDMLGRRVRRCRDMRKPGILRRRLAAMHVSFSIDKMNAVIPDGLFPGAGKVSRAAVSAILGNLPGAIARARFSYDQ